MKLGRSFFSLYFLIVFIFISFTWVLDEIWNSYVEQNIESYTGYKTMLVVLDDYLQKHPQDEWAQIVERASERYNLPFHLLPMSELSHEKYIEHNKLSKDSTHVYYYNKRVMLHHMLANSEQILTLGPTKMPSRPRRETFVRTSIFAVLGLMIFFWLWPISRDLDQLQNSASSFGSGELDVKAPRASSSMMGPMVNSFNMMAIQIKSLIDSHKELTNAVAHELRTPLARSKFALQMLSSVKDEIKRERYLKQISTDVSELDDLINELLLYASFANTKPELKFKRQNIAEMVNLQMVNYEQYEGEIDLVQLTENVSADCDYHFIERALHNYISNAIKYGKDQIRITISEEQQQCIVKVEDNGKGVSQEFKNVIFDAFSRGDNSRNKETGGFGLGLAIVGRIMEWHQGHVAVQDSNLGGACFVLSWPINQNSQVS